MQMGTGWEQENRTVTENEHTSLNDGDKQTDHAAQWVNRRKVLDDKRLYWMGRRAQDVFFSLLALIERVRLHFDFSNFLTHHSAIVVFLRPLFSNRKPFEFIKLHTLYLQILFFTIK